MTNNRDKLYCLDSVRGGLYRATEPLRITPKAMSVLSYLLHCSGRLVSKEELFEVLWPRVCVGDAALKVVIRELRAALRDEAKHPTLIETLHRRGYRFIGEVIPDEDPTEVAAPIGTAGVSGPIYFLPSCPVLQRSHAAISGLSEVFAGRHEELNKLLLAWAKARQGEPQLVFITGELGIGKSRLIQALVRAASTAGSLWVAEGHCFEQRGRGEPYFAVFDALSALYRGPDRDRVLKLLSTHAPSWLAHVPAYNSDGVHAGRGQLSKIGKLYPRRMLREMVEAIEALAFEVPLLLILEDLHWGDEATLDLLSCLGRRPVRVPRMIVVSYRPDLVTLRRHPVRTIHFDLLARPGCTELAVKPLDLHQIADFFRAYLPGSRVPQGLAKAVFELGDGNPLFMRLCLDEWSKRGWLGPSVSDSPYADLESTYPLPEALCHIIESQLQRLRPAERHLLQTASVEGGRFRR